MPIVSVIIPTYNRKKLLIETLTSVFEQEYKDFEIIVVDDGSTDNTKEALHAIITNNLIKYIYQDNAGSSSARNAGIKNAKGKYLTFLDSDDLYSPTKLRKQVVYLDKNLNISIIHCDYSKFDNSGIDLGYRNTSFFEGWIYPSILKQWSMLMGVSCVMVRSNIFEKVGFFDESLEAAEDLDMWARIAYHYEFRRIPENLVKIRAHSSSMSANKEGLEKTFRIYLEKAFERDPELTRRYKNRILSTMYTYSGLNLLGEGNQTLMKAVRNNSKKAIKFWPFELKAYLCVFQ